MVTEKKVEIQVESMGQARLDLGGQFSIVGYTQKLSLQTPQPSAEQLAWVDITEQVSDLAHRSGLTLGMVLLYSQHTTCTVVVNERESLLMKDVAKFLNGLAPRDGFYLHNQFDIRTENMNPDESPNGHAHCQAWLLGNTQWVPVVGGRLMLGTWQRVFVVELDSSRPRQIIMMAMGAGGSPPEGPAPLG